MQCDGADDMLCSSCTIRDAIVNCDNSMLHVAVVDRFTRLNASNHVW